jgi:hypothetical protein
MSSRRLVRAIVALVCMVSADAVAQPATPPVETKWLDTVSFEAAARVGLAALQVSNHADAASRGTVAFFEGEAGVRVIPRVTVAAFGDYFSEHDRTGQFDNQRRFYDLGARLHVHAGLAFFGLGLGYENQRKTSLGVPPLVSVSILTPAGTIYELHGGVTAPVGGHVGIQLLAIASYSSEGLGVVSLRGALGVQLR